MSAEQRNLYDLIGMSRDASQESIVQRCLSLGEELGPDKNAGNLRTALLFAQIEKAYEILGDPVRRAAYDAELREKEAGYASSVGPRIDRGPDYPANARRWGQFSRSKLIAIAVVVIAAIALTGGIAAISVRNKEAARAAEAQRVAEETARRAAEERARELEARAKAAEERVRMAAVRAAEESAPRVRRMTASELRADKEDLARVENVRAQCEAAGRSVERSRGGGTFSDSIGTFVGAQLAIPICMQSERAVKDRLRYEALRSEDTAAAMKELELQRAARIERQRNRPVITNCTTDRYGNTNCISR